MADSDEADPRLDEVQDEIDAIEKRLPHDPGMDIVDPDIKPIFPDDEAAGYETDDDG